MFVSIGLVVRNVNQQIVDQTKPLVGADIVLESSQVLSGDVDDRIATILADYDTQLTQTISMSTNLTLDGNDATLVQLE
jgi:predicted lysophospholipase L1 biosynthesis ABC-type transport system permease subunit